MAQTQVQPRSGEYAAQEPEAGQARWRPNRPILIGAALIVLAVVWWAISYGQIASGNGVGLADATQCLLFRGESCEALIAGTDIRFPLYYHFVSLWPGILLVLIGLWRMTPLSNDPPEWFLAYRITFFRILAVIGLILIWWEASARAGPNIFPDPARTFAAAVEMFGDDRNQLRVGFFDSLRVYISGFVFGVLLGIPIGLILGGFRILGRTMEVFMNALMATPRVAFIPLIILFLGLGYEAKTFVIFLGAVMPIMVNTYAGVRNSDGELVEMARSAGATRGKIFIRILLPGALPFIVVGLRIGATIGLINTVVAELYTATTGLGGLLQVYRATFRMDNYIVVVLCLSLIGVVVTSLLRILESRTERWRYNGN
jgi:NitT/TauT family transport system permease protein